MKLIRKYKQGNLTTADVRTINNTVICLLILVAVTSIIWSISIHILSGDYYDGFIGAKIIFRRRDFTQMDDRAKQIFYHDLGILINETYTDAALDNASKNNVITTEKLIMPEQPTNADESQITKKPHVIKLAHVFQSSSSLNLPDEEEDDDDDSGIDNSTSVPKVKTDVEHDRKFLANNVSVPIDIHQSRWRHNAAVQFVYSFPFLSEIIAIIWTAMCLIYQSSVNKYWGLPKPWRIVIPSILLFTLMSIATLTYTILANMYLNRFCTDLRAQLSNPNAISCGQAISVLRPLIRQHEFTHSVYLNLFRVSYILNLVLWLLALLVMVLRFTFAIDFQLVDVPTSTYASNSAVAQHKETEYTEVFLSSPQHQPKLLQVDQRHKSEDDFQSAKSHISEVATPLLELPHIQRKV